MCRREQPKVRDGDRYWYDLADADEPSRCSRRCGGTAPPSRDAPSHCGTTWTWARPISPRCGGSSPRSAPAVRPRAPGSRAHLDISTAATAKLVARLVEGRVHRARRPHPTDRRVAAARHAARRPRAAARDARADARADARRGGVASIAAAARRDRPSSSTGLPRSSTGAARRRRPSDRALGTGVRHAGAMSGASGDAWVEGPDGSRYWGASARPACSS